MRHCTLIRGDAQRRPLESLSNQLDSVRSQVRRDPCNALGVEPLTHRPCPAHDNDRCTERRCGAIGEPSKTCEHIESVRNQGRYACLDGSVAASLGEDGIDLCEAIRKIGLVPNGLGPEEDPTFETLRQILLGDHAPGI